jgi:hypothetical protein
LIPSPDPRRSDNFNARHTTPFRAERSHLHRLLASSQTAEKSGIGLPDRDGAGAFAAPHCRDAAGSRRARLQLFYPIAIPGQPMRLD